MKDRYVNASEIATYTYCQKAWHLAQIGTPSSPQNAAEREAGIDWHGAHSNQVAGAQRASRLATIRALAVTAGRQERIQAADLP